MKTNFENGARLLCFRNRLPRTRPRRPFFFVFFLFSLSFGVCAFPHYSPDAELTERTGRSDRFNVARFPRRVYPVTEKHRLRIRLATYIHSLVVLVHDSNISNHFNESSLEILASINSRGGQFNEGPRRGGCC